MCSIATSHSAALSETSMTHEQPRVFSYILRKHTQGNIIPKHMLAFCTCLHTYQAFLPTVRSVMNTLNNTIYCRTLMRTVVSHFAHPILKACANFHSNKKQTKKAQQSRLTNHPKQQDDKTRSRFTTSKCFTRDRLKADLIAPREVEEAQPLAAPGEGHQRNVGHAFAVRKGQRLQQHAARPEAYGTAKVSHGLEEDVGNFRARERP